MFRELNTVNPVKFWNFLKLLSGLFPVLISFLSGKNALLYRKYLHNGILLRLLHFVFIMKYLKLKKYVMKNFFHTVTFSEFLFNINFLIFTKS